MTIITLLTDFGLTDPFVGILHAVLATRCPTATLVDLTHAILPQDVDGAAFWVERVHRWFPTGTHHLVVVDPGVGTNRPGIVARIDGQLYVGPHDGLFDRLIVRSSSVAVRTIASPSSPISATFHARDLFAPLLGDLASGRLTFTDVGPAIPPTPAHPSRSSLVTPVSCASGGFQGEVAWIDHFGNLITNIESDLLSSIADPVVSILGERLRLSSTYADVPVGELVAVVSGFDTLEVAVRNGDAAARLGVTRGTPVRVEGS
jgi:S-adenosyl-L-methionine hydrolase (adenosine-forming)